MDTTQIVFIILLIAPIFQVQSKISLCAHHSLAGCVCETVFRSSEHRNFITVNCTDQGFTNTSMLKELPKETQMLIFTGNNIPTLPWNVFGDLNNLTNLEIIDMSNNGIREIKGKAYHHVPNVRRLILNHNNLTISDDEDQNYHHPRMFSNFINLEELHLTNAFHDNSDAALANDLHDIFVNSELKKLFKLHLEQNEIKNFRDRNVFCDLPSLGDLHLGDNYLPKLNFNVKCLQKLRFLDLEKNNISELLQTDLQDLDAVSNGPNRDYPLTIDLRGNPLHCNSDIKTLYFWLKKTNVTVRDKEHLTCSHSNKYIVNLSNLVEARHAKVTSTVTILIVVMVIALISVVGAVAFLKRNQLKVKFAPVLDAVTRKVQYTTIESQDV